MKFGQILLLIVIIAIIVIQFFPTMDNRENEVPTTDLIKAHDVPSHVATLVHNACYDCHSNNTDYPWYNKVQPFAWYLEGHIQKGKHSLNFNEFITYSEKKQKKKLENAHRALKENKMPLNSYKLFHSEGRLSKSERKQITDWIEEELKNYD